MAAFLLSHSAVNSTITTAFKHMSSSSSYDDYIALALLAIGSVGYLSRGKMWNRPDPYHYKWFERPQDSILGGLNVQRETRDIAQKLEQTNRNVVIFWGSQSGTAEGFAHRLARDCHRLFKLDALVADLSDYDHNTIALIPNTKIAIFIISTYGDGEPSDNSADFLNWLQLAPYPSLKCLRYVAFGLGNTNYKSYNKVIDVVVDGLDAFGATQLLPVGRADDANGMTEEDFLEWKEKLFASLRDELALEEHDVEYEPTLNVVEDGSLTSSDLHRGEPIAQKVSRKSAAVMTAIGALAVKDIRELTNSDSNGRSCLHLDIDMSQYPQIKYKTGDHLAVWPVNPDQEVARLMSMLGFNHGRSRPISIFSLDPANTKVKVPTPTTISALFQNYLEICAPVSRETVLALRQFAPTIAIKSMLSSLAIDKSTYSAYLANNHITLGRLLAASITVEANATWHELPLSFVIESLSPMKPRYYSISSSSIISPRQASITVAVGNAPLITNNIISIPGVATSYLASMSPASSLTTASSTSLSLSSDVVARPTIYAHIRRSTFKLPANPSAPLILIAAGTGIAPFRAFLHERARLASMGKAQGSVLLFFGCRHPDQDFLYKNEIQELQSGVLRGSLEVVTAFSRVHNRKKVYVQDRIEEFSEQVVKMLTEDDATLYVCGSSNMAREVDWRVSGCVKQRQGWGEQEWVKWRQERKRARRWQEDVWG